MNENLGNLELVERAETQDIKLENRLQAQI